MTVQAAEPPTPPAGFPEAQGGEFHPITVRMVSDTTEWTCQACGESEQAGTGRWQVIAHAADHAMVTGHTVIERHVRVGVFLERA